MKELLLAVCRMQPLGSAGSVPYRLVNSTTRLSLPSWSRHFSLSLVFRFWISTDICLCLCRGARRVLVRGRYVRVCKNHATRAAIDAEDRNNS